MIFRLRLIPNRALFTKALSEMKVVLLGTGTSHGIPCIACDCDVCNSPDPHDKRLRCSAYVTSKNNDGTYSHILIDIGPEFRIQAITYKIKAVDAVLLTHSHADHLHGLDDIRIFSHTISSSHLTNPDRGKETEGPGIAIYSNAQSIRDVQERFSYVFRPTQIGGGKPKLRLEEDTVFDAGTPPEFGDLKITPVPMKHGEIDTTGWLISVRGADGVIHSFAYLTDCSIIPESSIQKIIDNGGIIEHCVIDGLREVPHATHFSYLQAMQAAEKICPVHTWFTHICHLKKHADISAYIHEHLNSFENLSRIVRNGGSVEPAYDGLSFEIN